MQIGGDPLNPSVTLVAGATNVLNVTAAQLAALPSLTFNGPPPSAQSPLLINVSGSAYAGPIPNLAGVSGVNAPYMLWNFPDATTVDITGNHSVEGTLYAPIADVNWQSTANVEGNVIASNFTYGSVAAPTAPRELHDFPFDAQLTCTGGTVPPTTTPATTTPQTTDPTTPTTPTTPAPTTPATSPAPTAAPTGPGPGGDLAATGESGSTNVLLIGLGLLLTGGGLLVMNRMIGRRRVRPRE